MASDEESHFAESFVSASTDSETLHKRKLNLEIHLPAIRKAYLKASDAYRQKLEETLEFLDEKNAPHHTDKISLRKSVVTLHNVTAVLTSSMKILRIALNKHMKVINRAITNGDLRTDTKLTSAQLSSAGRSPVNSLTLSEVSEPDLSLKSKRLPKKKKKITRKEPNIILISDGSEDEQCTLFNKRGSREGQAHYIVISDDSDGENYTKSPGKETLLDKCNTSAAKRKSCENENTSPTQSSDEEQESIQINKIMKYLESPSTEELGQKVSSNEESKPLFNISSMARGHLAQQSLLEESTDIGVEQPITRADSGRPSSKPSLSSSPVLSPLSRVDYFRRPLPFNNVKFSPFLNSPLCSPSSPSQFSSIPSPESPTFYFRRPSPMRNSPSPRVPNNSFQKSSPTFSSSPISSPTGVFGQSPSSGIESLQTTFQSKQQPFVYGHSSSSDNIFGSAKKPDEDRNDRVNKWLENSRISSIFHGSSTVKNEDSDTERFYDK